MAKFNPGRNVGRLSIRVVPDTTKFRAELKRDLEKFERTTTMTVNVDRANLNRAKIREDIRRQMATLKNVAINIDVHGKIVELDQSAMENVQKVAKIKPTLDGVAVERMRREMSNLLRDVEPRINDRRIRQQIDVLHAAFDKVSGRLANDIMSPKDAERLRERLHRIRDQIEELARDRDMELHVNPFTAWATARLRWLTRPRTVEIIAHVSKSSVVAALTTLSALSGARLSWKWIDSLINKMKELDRNLPAILGATTGITSLVAALFAATSGLVGIGEGLFSISPALLVLPGLFINALGSLTALIVALRNAGTELSPLKDDMRELGDIINGEFWGRARQPILDLVTGLMPQLRTAFADLSAGVGDFTAAMSNAFGKELANGRLASIFNGIAEGWRVLATGADGFAGALVSLSNIAARYTPRLASWFVRQANTFDKWLKAISEDGRLGAWMEDAIDSMYDLWDATRGIAGVFAGIWKAAEKAGSGGLHGFAQLMLTWRRVVNSADFQQGLEAVFRGSYVAMEAFGDAVKGIGRLVRDNSAAFETFIGSAGIFLGGLIEGIADALNTPLVANGLNDLSGGLIRALEGVLPHLPAIADTFGNFLGLLGDLAGTLLPAAAGVLAELMPGIDGLIDAIRPALPGLSQAVTDIAETLGPAISDLLKALGPAVIDAMKLLADAIVAVAPLLGPLIEGLAALVRAIADLLGWMTDGITDLATNKPDGTDIAIVEAAKAKGIKLELDLEAIADINVMLRDLNVPGDVAGRIQQGLINPQTLTASATAARELADAFRVRYEETLKEKGQFAADALVEGIVASDLPESVKNAIGAQLNGLGYEYEYFKDVGKASAGLLAEGLNDGKLSIAESMKQWRERFINEFEKTGVAGAQELWDSFHGYDQDSADMQGLLADLRKYGIDIKDVFGDAGKAAGKEAGKGLSTEFMEGLKSSDFHLGARDAGKDAAEGLVEGFSSGGGGGGAGGGRSFSRGLAQGILEGKPEVASSAKSLGDSALQALSNAATLLFPTGQQTSGGMRNGIASGIPAITSLLGGLGPVLRGAMSGAGSWLNPQGRAVSNGFASGIGSGRGAVSSAASGLRSAVFGAIGSISLYGTGRNMGLGMARGIRSAVQPAIDAAVSLVNSARGAARARAEIRSPSRLMARDVGAPLAQGVAMGIDRNREAIRQSMSAAVDLADVGGASPGLGGALQTRAGVNLHIHNPVVRDLMQETYDAANMAGVLV